MNRRSTQWTYATTSTSEDKSRPRSSTRFDRAFELVGADGSVEGGLRPLAGFRKVRDFDFYLTSGVSSLYQYDSSAEVIDFFPVTFRVNNSSGDEGYCYGYVYRVQQTGKNTTVCIEYFNSLAGAGGRKGRWFTPGNTAQNAPTIISDSTGTIDVGDGPSEIDTPTSAPVGDPSDSNNTLFLTDRFPADRKMSVSVWGRFVYIFCEGHNPVLFYVDDNANFDPKTIGARTSDPQVGPGKQPQLKKDLNVIGSKPPDDSGSSGVNLADSHIGEEGSGATNTLHRASDSDFPAIARIVATTDTAGDGLININYGGSSDNPSYHNTASGEDAETVDADAHLFEHGDYSFAYYLFDTRTNRRSGLSQVCEAKKEDFTSETARYLGLDIRYDAGKYNQAYVYRSVRMQDAGGSYVGGILHLEAIIDLNSWGVKNGESDGTTEVPAASGTRTAVYWYQLNDTSLVYQDVYVDKSIYDEVMPKGGSSLLYEGTMLVSNIRDQPASTTLSTRLGDSYRGLGETRWSSVYELSPELFPPLNRYVPDMPTNTVDKFLPVGPAVIGFSRDRVYYIMKEGAFLRQVEAHKGLGVVNHRAADTVGPMAYYLASQGLKAIHMNTQIDDVNVLDKLISEDWGKSSDKLIVSFDPTQMCVFVFNPDLDQVACLWFNTGKVTEIHDATFSLCSRGHWTSVLSDSTARLEERVLWVMNHPTGTASDNTDFKAGIWILDNKRQNLTEDNKPMVRMLQSTCANAQHAVNSVSTANSTITLTNTGGEEETSTDLVGGFVYVIANKTSAGAVGTTITPGLSGMKAKIIKVNGNILHLDPTQFAAISAASNNWADVGMVSVSPMYFRYVGPPVTSFAGSELRPPGGNNVFRVKHLSSLGAYFSDVAQRGSLDTATNKVAYWRAGLYEGDSTTFKTNALPIDRDGDVIEAIKEGDPDTYAAFYDLNETQLKGKHGFQAFSVSPALEIFCADVDYRLIQLQAKGTITATNSAEVAT